MTGVHHWLRTRIFPPVPDAIWDDVAILRANRVETLTPMLFLMLAATTPTAIYGGVATVHPAIRIGSPVIACGDRGARFPVPHAQCADGP